MDQTRYKLVSYILFFTRSDDILRDHQPVSPEKTCGVSQVPALCPIVHDLGRLPNVRTIGDISLGRKEELALTLEVFCVCVSGHDGVFTNWCASGVCLSVITLMMFPDTSELTSASRRVVHCRETKTTAG